MRLKRKGRMRGGMRGKNMYFKLSIRNAKRSFSDYLLYLVTVSLLLAIMESSNAVALTGNELAGFQTASLPFLIVIILIILICRMNDFMLKQRAKEFASYLLMGMEKRKLTAMFLGEFWIMGACCFIIGASCGIAVSGFIYMTILRPDGVSSGIAASILGSSIFHTFLYFCLTEGICSFIIGCRLVKMQIGDLIQEEKRSGEFRSMEKCRRWGLLFGSSFVCFLAGVLCIAFLPDKSAFPLISVIAIPLLSTVFSGYRFFFGLLCRAREAHAEFLYRKSRLYPMSWMLSNPGTDALLNAVFCIGKKPDTDKGDSAKADCAQTGDADGNGLAAPFSLYAACELEAESTFPRYHGKYSAKIRRRIQSVRAVLLPALFCSHLQNEHLNKQHFNRNHVKMSILDGIFRKNGFLFRGIGQRCKETT